MEIGDPSEAMSHPTIPTGATVTTFNNLNTDNSFAPATSRTTPVDIDQELTTDLEELVLSL